MTSDGKFRKREHILKTRDFMAVYKKGLSVRNGPLVLCWLPNGLAHSRVGFSVSSRNVKSAVRRNRMRRLFREAYRKRRHAVTKPADLVLVFKREMPRGMRYADAEKVFMEALSKAGVLA